MNSIVIKCDCCNENKKGVEKKKLTKRYFWLCPECVESLKWTRAVLRAGTNWIIEKFPDRFQRASEFSVTPC